MIELLLEAERALSMGRADRAEELYRQVAGADPRNSIAVVGLARVALERADDAGALVLARRALTIDAENVAAQRLVQRLEEVMRERGEALPAAEAAPTAGAAPIPEAPATAAAVSPPAEPAPAEVPAPSEVPAPAEPAPARRPTPFDGDDPVLAPLPGRDADRSTGKPASPPKPAPTPSPEPEPRRRSLLDRLRGR